jgi:ABC-type transport system involved in multi-copper enzyme maturation permease subunit
MNTLWLRQIGGVLRLELKRTAFSKRSWWIYLLAAAPIGISLLHWMIEARPRSNRHSLGEDAIVFAALFLLFFLRGSMFFGCMGIFSSLFRGETLQKTLHYYFLTPVRRESLVLGKYAAGLIVSLMLFIPSVAITYLLLGRHFGPAWSEYLNNGPGYSHLGSYIMVATLACVGYGAVFLLCGLLFRNPMIPAVVFWVWEAITPFLPALLKKVSVIFYLRNLCPVEVPAEPPFSIMVIETDPTPAWLAIPGLLTVAALLLAYAAVSARRAEINYSSE